LRSHKPSAHYHIATVKGDLETGKTYQPWVTKRGDEHRFNAWNHVMSDTYNLDHPDMHASVGGNGGKGHNQSKEHAKSKRDFEILLTDLSSRGVVKNRDDMIDFLKENYNAEITRKGKDYLSFKLPGAKRAMKFKGHIFSEQFTGKESISNYVEQRKQRPAPEQSLANLHRLESKMKIYSGNRYGSGGGGGSNDDNVNKDLLDTFNRVVDNAISRNQIIETPALDLYDNISFKDATEHCKTIDLNNELSDYDVMAVAKFMTEYQDFKDDYEKFYDDNHESIMNEDDSEVLEERETRDNNNQDVFEAELNLKNQMNNLENTMNNEMKTAETKMNAEATAEQSKTQTRKQKQNTKSSGRRAPKVIDNSKELLAIWKQGDAKTKQNDMKNYIIAQKTMRAHDNAGLKLQRKKKKSKKKDDDKK